MTSTTSYLPPIRLPGTIPVGVTMPPAPSVAAKNDDRARVVLSSAGVRLVDQFPAERRGIVPARDRERVQLLVVDHAVHAVAAEDVEIADGEIDGQHFRLDIVDRAERARERVPVRMMLGFLVGDLASAHEVGDE